MFTYVRGPALALHPTGCWRTKRVGSRSLFPIINIQTHISQEIKITYVGRDGINIQMDIYILSIVMIYINFKCLRFKRELELVPLFFGSVCITLHARLDANCSNSLSSIDKLSRHSTSKSILC